MMNNFVSSSRHQRRRLQTRKLLIDTALQLVLEKGYEAVSIQNITDRADLGRGTFYIHFKDKEEIIWSAFQELFQRFESEAHQKLDRRTPQVEYYGLMNIFQHVQDNRDLYQVMFGRHSSTTLTARAQDYLASVFLNDIHNSPAAPEINFNIPEVIEVQILTGIISRLIFWWLDTPNDFTSQQMAAMTYEALYRKKAPPFNDSNFTQ